MENDIHHQILYIGKKIHIVGEVVHKLYSGMDITENEYELFKKHFDEDLFRLIAFQYKTDIFSGPFSFTSHFNDFLRLYKELLSCNLNDVALYINYPFEEVVNWRLRHNI